MCIVSIQIGRTTAIEKNMEKLISTLIFDVSV